jgi:outer membrane protein OmpA-like peptidoglycan-associated protein
MSGWMRALRPLVAVLVLAGLGACASRDAPLYPPRSFFIFFPTGSAEITAEGATVLDQIAAEAKRINATAVGIVGTSSASGASTANLRLSEDRAAAVETALGLRQVPRAIIVRTSQGEVQELAGPDLAGQRVEVVVSRADSADKMR